MKKVIGTTIAVLILFVLIYFFLAHNWMMTTCFYKDTNRMATILNQANKAVSEYKYLDVTYLEENVVGKEKTNIIKSDIKFAIKENGAYSFYAEKTLPAEDGKTVKQKIYFDNAAGETGTITLVQEGIDSKITFADSAVNDALKVATSTYIVPTGAGAVSKDDVYNLAKCNDIKMFTAYTEVTKENMEEYNSSLLFTFSPFQVGVDFTNKQKAEDGSYQELQYRIGFGQKILGIISKVGQEGVEGVEDTSTARRITYHTFGDVVEIPSLPKDIQAA